MRFIFVFIFWWSTLTLMAQQAITLNWQDVRAHGASVKSPFFVNASITVEGLPQYVKQYEGQYLQKAIISNAVFAPLTTSEINAVKGAAIYSDVSVQLRHGKARNQWVTEVAIMPIRNQNGLLEKLISFDLKVEKGAPPVQKAAGYPWKSTSVLATGEWYKIAVTKTGIHKIDHTFLRDRMGVDPGSIDPRNIKLYGNGGGMLPQLNSDTWYDDLDQNAIFVKGEADGAFNTDDYILFYAQGPLTWTSVGDTVFEHAVNVYSDTAFYFINFTSSGTGKRLAASANLSGATQDITYFDDYQVYESEENNVVHSGRNWYGHKFDFDLTETFGFSMSGVRSVPGITLTASLGALSQTSSSFQVSFNGATVGNVSLGSYSGDYPWLKKNTVSWNVASSGSGVQSVTLTYNKGTSSASAGYVDYIKIQAQRDLALYGTQTNFRSLKSLSAAVSRFTVTGLTSSTRIWDVTNIIDVKEQAFSLSGTTGTFSTATDVLKEFCVFTGTNFDAPTFAGRVSNQNLHALSVPDLLIVVHPKFKNEAAILAEHRRDHDGLTVELVEVQQVYNEFSSGMKDPSALRNLAKMMYDRDPSTFKYLLLFGDCSYDYKKRITNNQDYVPVYESRDSEYSITSHSSDDYFALLDDHEGIWCESGSSCAAEYLDIGVGRIPVKTADEAQGVVDKIIYYDREKTDIEECHDASTYESGKWKNEITLISDDSDGNRHLQGTEAIAVQLADYEEYHIDKIYLDAYEQVSGAGGQSAPAVVDAINKKMDRGALIFNYSGHGGELGLSHEGIITLDQIRNWDNINNMPLMFTATCEFGRYDDPERTSAGEYTVLNSKGGAISIITTTRPVYSNENSKINKAFFGNVFEVVDTVSNELPRLGDVMMRAKNGSVTPGNVNNRNFALLGDPSLRLAYPKHEVVLTSITTADSTTGVDTLGALGKVTMAGEVRNHLGQRINDFEGILEVSVFDKISTYTTLGDENGSPTNFQERDVKLFEGLATVKEGKFSFSFIVPKDINYTYGFGQVMFYASSHSLKTDANGSDQSFVVGGTSRYVVEDDTPPQISLYMDDESFVFGGSTGKESILLAKLFDENGINTTGVGIGHEISAVLDNRSDRVIVLNDFYTSELDDYQRGIVKYPLEDLAVGTHRITVKAWDTFNNSNEDYIEFVVVNDEQLALDHVLNYPNPFTTSTEFHFDHNRVCDDLQVLVQIYTISGKLVKTLDQTFANAPAHVSGIHWNGKDDFEQNIGRGVYVYKVKVRSLTDGSQVQQYQKLVILH